ncbi:MAG TPA: M20/M25/M40 family metallo-hydrolase [Steroidobacteraceae bacterium]|jgi:acetylornithine deacetylase/succinyl-diaminopimelate desuccinylase-like protein|nr:M20/M25/M40 family metallo-hydrolase [Steroidobacteraceae bacterium]
MKPTLTGRRLAVLACCLLPFAASAAPKDAAVPPDVSATALEMLKRSVAFKTVLGEGRVPAYAAYLAEELKAHGFAAEDIRITPMGETATLTAVYRGTDPKLKPLLVASHMDVVVAKREEWERDPFTPVVEDGFLFGRGSADNKFGLVTSIAATFWLKKEGFKPKRDIIIVLSGDEETAQDTTAALAQELKDAELLLNSDAGGAYLGDDGKPTVYSMQAAEKTYMDFEVTITNPGGHSSRPGPTNAIADLARVIDKVAAFRFPARLSELTKAYFKAAGPLTPGKAGEMMQRYADNPQDQEAYDYLYAQPEYVGQLGTTCVPTMLRGGHAPNALPQSATVNVNCRVFPGESVESVQSTLARAIDDPKAVVKLMGQPVPSDASPLREDVMKALRKAIDLRAPGLPIVPSMSAGATDSLYFRNLGVPSYGVGGLFMSVKDSFAHGLNERIPVASIDGALVQWRSLLRDLSR